MILTINETNKQLNADGSRKVGRPRNSKKIYTEIDQTCRINLLPVLIKCSPNIDHYFLNKMVSHLQIIGRRVFIYLLDNSIVEV